MKRPTSCQGGVWRKGAQDTRNRHEPELRAPFQSNTKARQKTNQRGAMVRQTDLKKLKQGGPEKPDNKKPQRPVLPFGQGGKKHRNQGKKAKIGETNNGTRNHQNQKDVTYYKNGRRGTLTHNTKNTNHRAAKNCVPERKETQNSQSGRGQRGP